MYSSTSLLKHGGVEHSGLSDSSKRPSEHSRRCIAANRSCIAFYAAALSLFCCLATASSKKETPGFVAAKSAAATCGSKLKEVENFPKKRKTGQTKTTQFTEDEVNSYLALDLKPKYHACLKSLVMTFEENKLQGVAEIDFDRLGSSSKGVLSKLISLMFSGKHRLSASGELESKNGKANFRLEKAQFDDSTLPNFLVEGIITAVGRKQKPPFDPLKPSEMPYKIEKVDVHPGYIIVYQ
jgi:hypothetical protein